MAIFVKNRTTVGGRTSAKTAPSRVCAARSAAGVAKPPTIMHSPRTRYQDRSRRAHRSPLSVGSLDGAAPRSEHRRSAVAAVSDARVPGSQQVAPSSVTEHYGGGGGGRVLVARTRAIRRSRFLLRRATVVSRDASSPFSSHQNDFFFYTNTLFLRVVFSVFRTFAR